MDSVLRPRDIQTRIRSGESPESVAVAAQTSVDKIMGFATPVLAERAYLAQQAQKASVRRRAGEGQVGQLGEAVTARLESCDVDPDSVEWDSWRREDGRWTLVADYVAGDGDRHAQFIYDVAGRYVVADDDEARWLVGERSAAAQTPQERSSDEPAVRGRLVSVQDEQLPLGDDAIAMVTGVAPGNPVAADEAAPEPRRSTEADWISTQASDRPTASGAVEREPADTLFDAPEASPPPSAAEPVEEPAEDDADEDPRQPPKPARSRGRASVPSWDEIMFGSNQRD